MSEGDRAVPHREGRTLMLLPIYPRMYRALCESSGGVFYNPAMAGVGLEAFCCLGMLWRKECLEMVPYTLSMG